MKALLSTKIGPPEALEYAEAPDPVAGEGEVVIAVKAAGVNFPDALIIEDKYQFKPERPFAPGGGSISRFHRGFCPPAET